MYLLLIALAVVPCFASERDTTTTKKKLPPIEEVKKQEVKADSTKQEKRASPEPKIRMKKKDKHTGLIVAGSVVLGTLIVVGLLYLALGFVILLSWPQ